MLRKIIIIILLFGLGLCCFFQLFPGKLLIFIILKFFSIQFIHLFAIFFSIFVLYIRFSFNNFQHFVNIKRYVRLNINRCIIYYNIDSISRLNRILFVFYRILHTFLIIYFSYFLYIYNISLKR